MNILIMDDDSIVRNHIESIVKNTLNSARTFSVSNGLDALKIIESNKIDLMLLDIELDEAKEVLGLDYAKLISRVSENTSFIVISAHDKYAVRSFEVHPFAYLVKPIDDINLIRTLQEWVLIEYDKEATQDTKSISINTKKGLIIIPFNEILFLEKEKRFIKVVTDSQVYFSSESLKEIEDKLDERFFKTYQSYIVNMSKISSLEILENRSWEINFDGVESKALLSRYKHKSFFEIFEEYRL